MGRDWEREQPGPKYGRQAGSNRRPRSPMDHGPNTRKGCGKAAVLTALALLSLPVGLVTGVALYLF